jgi:hypothetical protein
MRKKLVFGCHKRYVGEQQEECVSPPLKNSRHANWREVDTSYPLIKWMRSCSNQSYKIMLMFRQLTPKCPASSSNGEMFDTTTDYHKSLFCVCVLSCFVRKPLAKQRSAQWRRRLLVQFSQWLSLLVRNVMANAKKMMMMDLWSDRRQLWPSLGTVPRWPSVEPWLPGNCLGLHWPAHSNQPQLIHVLSCKLKYDQSK